MAKKPTKIQTDNYQRAAKTSFYIFAGKLSLLFLLVGIYFLIDVHIGLGLLFLLLAVANVLIRYKLMLKAVDKFSRGEGKAFTEMQITMKLKKDMAEKKAKKKNKTTKKK